MANQNTHNHEVGDIIDVYGKPVTKEEHEGMGEIVALRDVNHYYDVRFDDEPDSIFPRFIY